MSQESTKYWSKKQEFFAHKCENQAAENDGRILRPWTNRDGDEGETWELQQTKFSGLPESLYIEEHEWPDGRKEKKLCLGLQGDGFVNVLQFPLFKQKGGLTSDILKIARLVGQIDFTETLFVEIWNKSAEDHYLMLKRKVEGKKWPQGIKTPFSYNEESKQWTGEGIPEVTKTESMGEDVYDSRARDEFMYAIIEKAIADADPILKANKAKREQTPAEAAQPDLPNQGEVEDTQF